MSKSFSEILDTMPLDQNQKMLLLARYLKDKRDLLDKLEEALSMLERLKGLFI